MLKTPDITAVQLVAVAAGVVNTLVAFGVHLSSARQHVILADAGIVAALLVADGVIRNGRARGNPRP